MGRSQPPAGAIRIGISGWRYEGWRGVFYAEGLAQKRELEFASRAFPTIEINGSFYSLQTPQSYASWYRDTGPGFVFGIKGGRYITHIRRLREIEKPLANFFASGVLSLREKLGPFLWQFPPFFRYDEARFERFFELLPRDAEQALALAHQRDARMNGRSRLAIDRNRAVRHAVEIRNDSFASAAFVRQLPPAQRRARRRRYRWQMALLRGRDRRLYVSAPAWRRGPLRERLHGFGAGPVGGADPRLVARRRAR